MDEKIFVKNDRGNTVSEASRSSSSSSILGIVAVVIIVLGIIGLLITLGNSGEANTNTATQNPIVTDTEDTNNSEDLNTSDNNNGTPSSNNSQQPGNTNPPATNPNDFDDEKPEDAVAIFFPKNPESQTNANFVAPIYRDTPEENLTSFLLNTLFIGPDQTEVSQGFRKNWEFTGENTCDRNIGYSFAAKAGNVLEIRVCRLLTTGDINQFVIAAHTTIVAETSYSTVNVLNGDTCLNFQSNTVQSC